jgi:hypothetical protein
MDSGNRVSGSTQIARTIKNCADEMELGSFPSTGFQPVLGRFGETTLPNTEATSWGRVSSPSGPARLAKNGQSPGMGFPPLRSAYLSAIRYRCAPVHLLFPAGQNFWCSKPLPQACAHSGYQFRKQTSANGSECRGDRHRRRILTAWLIESLSSSRNSWEKQGKVPTVALTPKKTKMTPSR